MGFIRFGALLSVLLVTGCAQVDRNNGLSDGISTYNCCFTEITIYDRSGTNYDCPEYCVLKSGYNGMCVRYFNCDPKSIYMVRRTDPGWKCNSYLDVCCPENDILDLSSA